MKKLLFLTLFSLMSILSYTQNGENDFTFNTMDVGNGNGDGFNNDVSSTALQSDGKIIAGGYFTSFNGTSRNHITRINTDGTLDTSFDIGTGFNGAVNSVAIQSDGKIIVGGYFTSYNGIPANNIACLNVDGTLDVSFSAGGGFNDFPSPYGIFSVAIQSDGKILASGQFSTYNGSPANSIVRINSDGTLDNSFDPGTDINSSFNSIAIQSDGKIVVGGNCWSCNGTSINHILRLNGDGTMDVSFNPGTGFNNLVESLAIQSDGKIIVGGGFTSFNGTTRSYIARLNTNGSLDNSFDPGSGFNTIVHSVVIQSDQKIVTGGEFTSFNGATRNSIIRLNTDGTADNSFDIGSGFDARVLSLTIQSDGKVISGGDFSAYNGTTRNGIARINTDGSLDLEFTPVLFKAMER